MYWVGWLLVRVGKLMSETVVGKFTLGVAGGWGLGMSDFGTLGLGFGISPFLMVGLGKSLTVCDSAVLAFKHRRAENKANFMVVIRCIRYMLVFVGQIVYQRYGMIYRIDNVRDAFLRKYATGSAQRLSHYFLQKTYLLLIFAPHWRDGRAVECGGLENR